MVKDNEVLATLIDTAMRVKDNKVDDILLITDAVLKPEGCTDGKIFPNYFSTIANAISDRQAHLVELEFSVREEDTKVIGGTALNKYLGILNMEDMSRNIVDTKQEATYIAYSVKLGSGYGLIGYS